MHVVGEWTDVLPYDIGSTDKNGCGNTNLNENGTIWLFNIAMENPL